MTHRLDELERLQRLRESGAVDDAEFAAEKARVLAPRRGVSAVLAAALAIGLLAVLGFGAWLAVSRTPPPTTVAAGSRSVVPPARPVARPDRLAAAERAAFPNGMTTGSDMGSRIVYEPGRLVDAPFGPVLVNEGRVPDAAHVESGYVAIHYLQPVGNGFRVVKSWPEAVKSGSFGQMSEMALTNRFSDLPVVYSQGGGTWQGYTCGWTTLTELRPEGPVELVTFMNLYDDTGAKEDGGESTEGKIASIVRGRAFDVRFTGANPFTATYVRQGNGYRLRSGRALEGC